MLKKLLKIFNRKPPLFAKKGEEVTCENGHVVCQFSRTIHRGTSFDPHHLHRWRQTPPKVDSLKVECNICGAKFWHGFDGQNFHFADGWRGKPPLEEAANENAK